MKNFSYVLALLALLVAPIHVWSAPPPPADLPLDIARDQQGALRYLWEEIQHNTLWKALPDRYASVQPAWTEFLHNEASPIIESYYS